MPSFFSSSYMNRNNNEMPNDLENGFTQYIQQRVEEYVDDLQEYRYYSQKQQRLLNDKHKPTIYSPKKDELARFELRRLSDALDKPGEEYSNFILQRVEYEKQEIASVYPAFDRDILISFGKKPVYLRISGTLLNLAGDGDWLKQMSERYDTEYRAEKLVREGKILYLWYGTTVKIGYPLSISFHENSSNGSIVIFTMVMYVVDEIFFETSDLWSFYKIKRVKACDPITGQCYNIGDGTGLADVDQPSDGVRRNIYGQED